MAGEVLGESFEAIVSHCLSQIVSEYSWGKKPKGFSIDPDFIIGDIDKPTHWLLLTSSYSPKSFSEKFWRNVAEIFEAKTYYKSPPIVINLVLQSGQMATMQKALSRFVDLECLIDKTEYGKCIVDVLNRRIGEFQGERAHKVSLLKVILKQDKQFASAVNRFQNNLQQLLTSHPSTHQQLWEYERQLRSIRSDTVRSPRRTFIRRGLAKLCLLPNDVRAAIINGMERPLPSGLHVPDWAISSSIVRVQRGKYFLNDPEISNAIRLLGVTTATEAIQDTIRQRSAMWDKLRGLLSADNVQERDTILRRIRRSGAPSAVVASFAAQDAAGIRWFFWDLIELLKLLLGGKQKYGFGVLANDVGYKKGISEGYKTLADWANGLVDTSKCKGLVDDVAFALNNRLKEYTLSSLLEGSAKLAEGKASNVIEQKAVTYNMFEPLKFIICSALDRAQVEYQSISQPTLLGELIGEPDKVDTPALITGSTLIHWKSAHDKGKKHKVKELSGRASSITQRWSGEQFVERSEIAKKILLIDGTWTLDDLRSMKKAGWDDFFYGDELEDLLNSVT